MIRRLLSAVFHNLDLKLLALAIALGVWFYAASTLREDMTIDARIALMPVEGQQVVYQSEQTARFHVAGPRSVMNRVRALVSKEALARHRIPGGDSDEGWLNLHIQPDWLRIGLENWERVQLSFLSINPSRLRAYVSPTVTRTLPVRPVFEGTAPDGMQVINEPTVLPSEVTVTGPRVALKDLESIPTAPLSLYRRGTGIHQEPVALQTEHAVSLPDGQTVSVRLKSERQRVDVRFQIGAAASEEKLFRGLQVELMQPAGFPFEAQLEEPETTVTITVRGTAETLRRLTEQNVRPYVYLSPLANETIEPGATAPYREPVTPYLPPGILVHGVQVEPERVTIILKNPAQ